MHRTQETEYYVNRPQARTLMGPESQYQGQALKFYETGGIVEQLPGEIIGVLRGSNAPYITEDGERIGVFVNLPLIGCWSDTQPSSLICKWKISSRGRFTLISI